MSTAIESFFVALGFEVDSSDLKKFTKDIDSAKDAMMKVASVAAVAAGAIGLFVQQIASATDELGDFAEAEQVSVEMVSELGHAAQLSGSSLEDVKSSIQGVNRVVGEAALGIGRGAMTFQKLNMEAKNADGTIKTFDQIITEVSDKMKGMSRQESIAMASKLGIDRKLIPLLLSGTENIEALRKEARAFGAVTKRDAQISGAYMDSFDRTVFMVKGLARGIAIELMPAMTQMMNGMRQWFLANRDVVMSGVGKFLNVVIALLGVFWDWTMRIVGALLQFVNWLTSTNTGLALTAFLSAVIAKIAAYKMFSMLANAVRLAWGAITLFNVSALITAAILGAVIIGVALLIDEFINLQEGGESFLGDWIKEFPRLGEILQSIAEAVQAVWTYLQGLWGDIGPAVAELVNAFINLAVALSPVLSLLWDAFKLIVSFLAPIFLWLARIILESFAGVIGDIVFMISSTVSAIAVAIRYIATVFNTVFGGIRDFVSAVFNTLFGIVDRFIGGIKTAINFVGRLVGLDEVSRAARANGGGPDMNPTDAMGSSLGFEPTGGIGVAATPGNGSGTSTVTNTTTVQAPITVQAQSPADAAKSVSDHLNKANRSSIRNSQSAVAL